eukprot:CAMPEP_0170482068 /NCGR_PEP_ID=MMETSP0208-20121228/2254_1 /TAXON_ID=197538 /ORGANISM="Strombidium inclinatum, Strain S3" /LENGTH=172 /DNA_ID=CAMNT_0010754865 /DNA_START=80 /DNA_END=598 /DNA_ORIENTATION=+
MIGSCSKPNGYLSPAAALQEITNLQAKSKSDLQNQFEQAISSASLVNTDALETRRTAFYAELSKIERQDQQQGVTAEPKLSKHASANCDPEMMVVFEVPSLVEACSEGDSNYCSARLNFDQGQLDLESELWASLSEEGEEEESDSTRTSSKRYMICPSDSLELYLGKKMSTK